MLRAMFHTISRAASAPGAASSLTPSPQFWSKLRAFRETERGITTESVTKNLLGAVFIWRFFEFIDYGDSKAFKELKGLYAEFANERKLSYKVSDQLEELRSQAEKAKNGK